MTPYHHGALPAALLEAAEIILERDGIVALTLRATAREAGVSHAAPAHHFGDLSGLLSELAASGFIRLRDGVDARTAWTCQTPSEKLQIIIRAYVGFAQAHPGLFQLMFRSERLDWSRSSLASAGAAAFALLTLPEEAHQSSEPQNDVQELATTMAQWSFAHGMAMLLIDGRLGAFAARVPGVNVEDLIEEMLIRSLRLR